MKQKLLFLCPHGAAKSVIAAAYCQKLANEYGLNLHIASAGTEPDKAPAAAVVARLQAEGIDVSKHLPRQVTSQDIEQVDWVISLGCDIEKLAAPGKKFEDWEDIPLPSQNLDGACQSILRHVERLVENLARNL